MEPGKMIMMIFVLLLLVAGLYYLWKLLFDTSGIQDLVIQGSSSGGLVARKPAAAIATDYSFSGPSVVPQVFPGGEYSISTWIYVQEWDILTNKPFLTLSGGSTGATAYDTVLMYLGKTTNKLGVRVGTSSTDLVKSNYAAQLLPALAGSPYTDTEMKSLDVANVDLQRWLCITLVLNGTNADIYLDGKLTRSTVLSGPWVADGSNPTMTLGDTNSFNGLIGVTRAANIAYTPDRVYAYYQQGPFTMFSLGSLNPFQYKVTVSGQGGVIFSTGS